MATMAEMMIEIGVDARDLNSGAQQAQNDMRGIGNSVAELASSMDTSMADIRRQWRGMSEEMRQAVRQSQAELAPFRAQQQAIQYEFFQMAQGMSEYEGSTEDFMNQLTELGNRNRAVNDQMMANNNMARMGFIQGVATMLAASTASSKISANFNRMNNPLYRVNNGLLTVSGNLERMAARGQPAVLALRMLGPTASMKQLNDMTRLITAGIMRMNAVALVAAVGTGLLFAKLASSASETIPGFKKAADEMSATLGKAFEPMVQAFAAVVTPIMKVITAIAQLAIKFNEAHPFLAKLIQGFLMIIPLLTLILSPLAIGIGLFNGLLAAWGSISVIIMPLITGLAAMSGTVLIVAAVIVALVAIGVLLYKNWDTIKAKCIEIWGAIKSFFVSFWNGTKALFITVVTAVATFINDKFGYIFKAINTIMQNVWNIIKNYWNIIKNIFMGVVLIIVDLITGDFGSIKGHVSKIMSNIKTSISNIWNSIKTIFSTAVSAAKQYVVNAWNGMKTIVTTVGSGIKTAVTNAWNGVTGFLSSIDLVSIGKNIIQGLINGISSMASAVWKEIQKVAGGIKDKIKNALGIKSPSRWMRDMIGKNIVLGMAVGIDAESGTVMDSLDRLTGDLRSQAQFDLEAPDLPSFSNNVFSKQQKTDPVYVIELDGRQIAKGTLPHITDIVRLKTGLKFS